MSLLDLEVLKNLSMVFGKMSKPCKQIKNAKDNACHGAYIKYIINTAFYLFEADNLPWFAHENSTLYLSPYTMLSMSQFTSNYFVYPLV